MTKGLRNRQEHFANMLKNKAKYTGENVKQISPYTNYYKPVKIMTILYGIKYIFNLTPSNLKDYSRPIFRQAKAVKNFHNKLVAKINKTHERVKQLSPYLTESTPVRFRDLRTNNVFSTTPRSILGSHHRYYICPDNMPSCYRHQTKKRTKWTTAKMAKAISDKSNGKYILKSKYHTIHKKVLIEHHDKRCLYYQKHHKYYCFYMAPDKFLHQDERCPMDHDIRSAKSNTKTTSQFKHEIFNKTHGEFKVVSPYIKNYKKIEIIHCSKSCIFYRLHHHFYKFFTQPSYFLRHLSCPVDSKHIKDINYTKHHKELAKAMVYKKFNGKFRLLSKYEDNKTKALFEHHDKHCAYYQAHHKYYKFYDTLSALEYSGCPADSHAQLLHKNGIKFTKSVFRRTHGHYKICSKYHGEDHKMLIMHKSKYCKWYKKHHSFLKYWIYPRYFNKGFERCPYDHASVGEHDMIDWLHTNHLRMSRSKHYLTRHSNFIYGYINKLSPYTIYPQHFDIFIPNIKYDNYYTNGVEIEFNGGQHFKPTIYFSKGHTSRSAIINFGIEISKDTLKSIFCIKHHIKKLDIDNPDDRFRGKKLRSLVNKTLNKELLPVLHYNSDIIFREENE